MAEHCYSCRAPVEWALTPMGARIPLDLGEHDDGELRLSDDIAVYTSMRPARRSHYKSCPVAAARRRRRSRR